MDSPSSKKTKHWSDIELQLTLGPWVLCIFGKGYTEVPKVPFPTKFHGQIPSGRLTWQWNTTIFNRKCIFKGFIFHCYVRLPECNSKVFCWKFIPMTRKLSSTERGWAFKENLQGIPKPPNERNSFINHQHVQVPKMEVLNITRQFWGCFFVT